MESLDPHCWSGLQAHFLPDRPGPLIGLHAIHTRLGAAWVDRWPDARGGAIFTGGNLMCWGDPATLPAADLVDIVRVLLHNWDRVLIDMRPGFEIALRRAVPGLMVWPRVILAHEHQRSAPDPPGAIIRRLAGADASLVSDLDAQIAWISDTYGGGAAMAENAAAWGAFVDGRLVSVAVPYFVGHRYEDIGIVTEPGFRARGLSGACAARVVAEIRARQRTPSWSTSPDNRASLRVAEKLGFVKQRDDVLYIAGAPLPGATTAASQV